MGILDDSITVNSNLKKKKKVKCIQFKEQQFKNVRFLKYSQIYPRE